MGHDPPYDSTVNIVVGKEYFENEYRKPRFINRRVGWVKRSLPTALNLPPAYLKTHVGHDPPYDSTVSIVVGKEYFEDEYCKPWFPCISFSSFSKSTSWAAPPYRRAATSITLHRYTLIYTPHIKRLFALNGALIINAPRPKVEITVLQRSCWLRNVFLR